MVVRIQFPKGSQVSRKPGKNRHVAYTFAALLKPATLMTYVLGLWALSSELKLATEFPFHGVYSHWQIWFALGAALQIASFMLNRYGTGGELRFPRVFFLQVAEPVAAEAPKARSAAAG